MEALKNNWKRYLTSSLITFVAAFLLIAVPELLREDFVWSTTTVFAVLSVAIRVGVKAVWEIVAPMLMSWLGK